MRQATLALALVVAVAGCTAFVGPSPEPTPTRAASSADSSSAPSATVAGDVGVTAGGVTDPRRLATSHAEFVRGLRSYEATKRWVFRAPNGTVRGRIVRRVRVNESGRRFASRLTVAGERPGRFATTPPQRTFSNGTVTVVPILFGDSTESFVWPADEAPVDGPPPVVDWRLLVTVFEALDTRVAAVEQRDGTDVYVVRGGPGPVPSLNATNATVEARVARSGFVRSVTVRYEVVDDGRWRVEQSVSYEGLDATTVPRPAWVDPALANATRPATDDE